MHTYYNSSKRHTKTFHEPASGPGGDQRATQVPYHIHMHIHTYVHISMAELSKTCCKQQEGPPYWNTAPAVSLCHFWEEINAKRKSAPCLCCKLEQDPESYYAHTHKRTHTHTCKSVVTPLNATMRNYHSLKVHSPSAQVMMHS